MWSFAAYFVSGVVYRWIPLSIICPYSLIGLTLYLFLRSQRTVRLALSKNGACIFLQFKFCLNFSTFAKTSWKYFGETTFQFHLNFFSFGCNAFYFLAKRIKMMIPEIKFLKPVRTEQIFCDTGIIISPSNFILSPVTVRAILSSLLSAYLIFSMFVSLLLINQSQSLTEILLTYLVRRLLCIYERLCLTCPRFLYV